MSKGKGTYSDFWVNGGEASEPNVRVEDGGKVAHVVHSNGDGTERIVPTPWEDIKNSGEHKMYNPDTGEVRTVLDVLNPRFHGDPCEGSSREAGREGYSRRK